MMNKKADYDETLSTILVIIFFIIAALAVGYLVYNLIN